MGRPEMNVREISMAHDEVQEAIDRGAQNLIVIACYPDHARVAYCGEASLVDLAVATAMLQHDAGHLICEMRGERGDPEEAG